jgi:predicted enzyme related to lactoylglutathione lyase
MNPVIHFEMPYIDKNRAAEFYSKTFGWAPQMLGPEMGEYVVMQTGPTDEKGMVQQPGVINGGMYKRPEDPKGQYPSFVIAVPDITSALEKIKQSGGTSVSEPMDIPGVGTYATFVDTEGNRLSIMQPKKM